MPYHYKADKKQAEKDFDKVFRSHTTPNYAAALRCADSFSISPLRRFQDYLKILKDEGVDYVEV